MSEVDHQISAQTVADYCEAYAFLDPADLDPALIGQHWNLERRLAAELQASTPEDRADTFEAAYSALYDVLKWHDQVPNARQSTPHEAWEAAIGEPPQTIYEIGAGHGLLLHHLAEAGHICRGTEITRHRGGDSSSPHPRISWGATDGVHLDRFEQPGSFDVVITNQVVEHLHPDDLDEHLRTARSLLVPGGRYILSTPHPYTGPHDVSQVFGHLHASGMHLKEYTWSELSDACVRAGFTRVEAATTVLLEPKIQRLVGGPVRARRLTGGPYLRAMRWLERLLGRIRNRPRQRRVAERLHDLRIFADNVFLICEN